MDIVAILACRNEEPYLGNCLRHLRLNGISYAVINNGSADATKEILERPENRRSLLAYRDMPFSGAFELEPLLQAKLEIVESLGADWVIHHDTDEVRHSYHAGESLHDAIVRLATGGATVINFDEFVFLPIDHAYLANFPRWQPMRHYYFFEPGPHCRMNAWKTGMGLSMVRSGGHKLHGTGMVIAEEPLAMRHYIFRDQKHAYEKYAQRVFSRRGLCELGWHNNRVNQPVSCFKFPPTSDLQRLDEADTVALSKADPKRTHYWQWAGGNRGYSSGVMRAHHTASGSNPICA
jgi:glycosyltransferase involved in cell wall biosynthesis